MAKPWTPVDSSSAGSLVQQGYGQETGLDYRPWIDEEKVWQRRPVVMLKGGNGGQSGNLAKSSLTRTCNIPCKKRLPS